jgi:hypothetical protein
MKALIAICVLLVISACAQGPTCTNTGSVRICTQELANQTTAIRITVDASFNTTQFEPCDPPFTISKRIGTQWVEQDVWIHYGNRCRTIIGMEDSISDDCVCSYKETSVQKEIDREWFWNRQSNDTSLYRLEFREMKHQFS